MKKTFFLFVFFGFFFSGLVQAEELRLEGVMMDPDPTKSIAVINGQFLKQGQSLGSHEVLSVAPKSVQLRNKESGEEMSISLKGKPKTAAQETAKNQSPLGLLSGVSDSEAPKDLKGTFEALLALPGQLINRFFELRGVKDLVTVNNASVSYFNARKTFPGSLSDLVRANFLPESFEDGLRGKYRLYVVRPPNPTDFGVHADPIDQDSPLRSFYVGTDVVIREAYGKAANKSSPPHDY